MSTVTSKAPALARAFVTAATVVARVLAGESLNVLLAGSKRETTDPNLAAAAQDLSYNTLRGYGVLDMALGKLLDRPLTDLVLRALLLTSLAEFMSRPQSAHVIVHQAVEAAGLLGRSRAKSLVNAVLRNFQRNMSSILSDAEETEPGRYKHPQWWIDAIRETYPLRWQSILLESNRHPPMVLRVNRRRCSALAYAGKLAEAGLSGRILEDEAIVLDKPCKVEKLPRFFEGEVSVQDAGAQRAARLLDVRHGMRVLDACAAPGGKTGHILELADCALTAVDADSARASRIAENLTRLGLSAQIVVGDCRFPEAFSNGSPYERILLDAPCSGSGVVRRHPDIRWLRRKSDLSGFARIQAELLDALWQVLAPNGKLLYATCSVFDEENGRQIREFLNRHPEASALAVPGTDAGQILPEAHTDGFYYALLRKERQATNA